jgi:hypothetical protein
MLPHLTYTEQPWERRMYSYVRLEESKPTYYLDYICPSVSKQPHSSQPI